MEKIMTAEELFKRIIDIQQNTYHQSLETERMIIEDECVKLINDNFIPIKGSRMKEETKILLTKLFRKYQTIGAISENPYLTEQDYNFLIHDKSFPVKNAEEIIKAEIKRLEEKEVQSQEEMDIESHIDVLNELNILRRILHKIENA